MRSQMFKRKSFLKVALVVFALMNPNCASVGFGGGESIKVPDYQEETFANGLRFVRVKDRTLPLVNIGVMVAPGASSDPVGRSGLMFVTTEMMEKGTLNKSADQLADAFAAYGTTFSSSATHDYVSFSVDTMSANQLPVFDLFKEVMTQPKFDQQELDIFKTRLLASIKQNYDNPDSFADLVFSKQVMGSHAYARPVNGTERDVKGLSRADVLKQFNELIRPSNMTFLLTGDYSDELVNQIRSVFSSWNPSVDKSPMAQFTTKAPVEQKQLLLIDRDDLEQTQVRVGHLGVKRNDPDYWALQVANVILGGNFSSRLVREVRVKRGLTYSVNSSFTAGVFEGPFEVSTFTRHDKVGETVQVTLDVLKEFKDKGVKADEVAAGKNYLKGHLIRQFEKPEDVVRAIVRMKFYGLSKEDITNVVQKLDAVSADDVNRVVKNHFRPENLRVVIYSTKAKVIDQLRSMGALDIRSYRDFL